MWTLADETDRGQRPYAEVGGGSKRDGNERNIDITTLRNGTDHQTLSKPEPHND